MKKKMWRLRRRKQRRVVGHVGRHACGSQSSMMTWQWGEWKCFVTLVKGDDGDEAEPLDKKEVEFLKGRWLIIKWWMSRRGTCVVAQGTGGRERLVELGGVDVETHTWIYKSFSRMDAVICSTASSRHHLVTIYFFKDKQSNIYAYLLKNNNNKQ